MKNLMILAAAVLLIASACDNKPKTAIKVVKGEEKGVLVEYQMDSVKKVKQGYYKIYHAEGILAAEMTYVNDTLEGVEKNYHEDGKTLKGEFVLVKGKYHGNFKYYHLNGKLAQEGKYVNHVMEGELKTYYENGQLKEVVTMAATKENGPFTEYHENGKLKAKGVFKDGPNTEYCLLEIYNKNGELESKRIGNGKGTSCAFWTAEKGNLKPSSSICEALLKEMKTQCQVTEQNK